MPDPYWYQGNTTTVYNCDDHKRMDDVDRSDGGLPSMAVLDRWHSHDG